jgi:hypothetical protein
VRPVDVAAYDEVEDLSTGRSAIGPTDHPVADGREAQ